MDLMTAYRNLGPTIYGYIKTRWVKGHQDWYLLYNKLSTQAKMNMQADKLAEIYREQHQAPHRRSGLSQPCVDPIPGQVIQLVIKGYAISQSHAHWIRFQIAGYAMRYYLQDRHDWDKPTWEAIDWFGFEKAIRSRPPTMQRWVSKFVNGWWNVGKQRRCINSKDFLLCPRCKLCRETMEHVLYCSRLSPETQVFGQTLKDTMGSITPDTIINMLFSVLQQLSVEPGNSPRLVISPTLPPKVRTALRQAIREQAVIGWPLLLRGYLARSWTVAYT